MQSADYVRALFSGLLGREPGAAALDHYTRLIDSGNNLAPLVDDLLSSPEFQNARRNSRTPAVDLRRVAVLAAPRCGNNWIRRVVGLVYGVPDVARFDFRDFPMPLPPRAILNVHWRDDPAMREFLAGNDIQPVALARHPLDALVSIHQFAASEPGVHLWLGGAGNIPRDTGTTTPQCETYVDWMCSDGAKLLMSVSLDWWRADITRLRVRYEDFERDPDAEIRRWQPLFGPPVAPIRECLEQFSVAFFARHQNHGWVGKSGNYRRFLTPEACQRVREAHREVFEEIGYEIDPDPDLDEATAKANYRAARPMASSWDSPTRP